ncbi:MAG TPA: SDR family oxidoreductase [Planctomycetota bacterium]|nr:SDR family oxidoreductase [Planctomycetota bacterium]
MSTKKSILITGTSSGIGKACADHLTRRGHQVFGASRTPPAVAGPIPWISMDVTDDRSVQEGVEDVVRRAGRLDVVVNNAGMGFLGAIEDTSIEEAKRLFEVNLFGVLRVCRAALPVMRRQGSGRIVNISSIGGVLGLPFEGLYSASKFALEGLSEALRMELRPWGIPVVLVEPGDIRTDFPKNRIRTRESGTESAYRETLETVLGVMARDEQNASSPDLVARVVGRIVERESPALRYRVGPFLQVLAARVKGLLPSGIFEALVRSAYKL